MKRLLFTATYAQPYLSGITDYIQRVTTHLAKTNEVSLQVFQHDSKLPTQEKIQNVLITRLKPNFKLSKGFIRWSYPFDVWSAVQQADEVFINLPQVESIFVAAATKLQHKKLKVIYHCELVFETGLLNKLIAFIANVLADWVCDQAETIIVYTTDYADHSAVLRHHSQKIQVVPPPVELEKVDQNYVAKLKNLIGLAHPVIGFSGRISREKGLTYLVKALERLKTEYPQLLLLCSGPYGNDVVGETRYFKQLLQLCETAQVSVQFLGKITRAELAAFYTQIDLLTLPSTNRTEAFGLVQVEALLSGKPVVTTDLPGVRSVVQQTKGGVVVPIKDSAALAAGIKIILKNPENFAAKKITENTQKFFSLTKTLNWFSKLVAV